MGRETKRKKIRGQSSEFCIPVQCGMTKVPENTATLGLRPHASAPVTALPAPGVPFLASPAQRLHSPSTFSSPFPVKSYSLLLPPILHLDSNSNFNTCLCCRLPEALSELPGIDTVPLLSVPQTPGAYSYYNIFYFT